MRGCRNLECEALPTWVFTCGEAIGKYAVAVDPTAYVLLSGIIAYTVVYRA